LTLTSCGQSAPENAGQPRERPVAAGVLQIGLIASPHIRESSGLARCARDPNVFWTHNDGARPVLYGITRQGKVVTQYRIAGASLIDWEDVASDGVGHLYLGDLGNNEGARKQVAVHQIDEPDPALPKVLLQPKQTWLLRFPKKPFDCESLFVWENFGYVISKVSKDRLAQVYRFSLTRQSEPAVLEWVARLPIDSPVTGANISPDGRLLGVVAKAGAFVFRIDGRVSEAGRITPYQTRFRHEHIEGCCFVPEGLLATAESREIFLFTNAAFRIPK
jgi:hypothetical protein